jgi:hypothetical protein
VIVCKETTHTEGREQVIRKEGVLWVGVRVEIQTNNYTKK